jgi:hypothetical protein
VHLLRLHLLRLHLLRLHLLHLLRLHLLRLRLHLLRLHLHLLRLHLLRLHLHLLRLHLLRLHLLRLHLLRLHLLMSSAHLRLVHLPLLHHQYIRLWLSERLTAHRLPPIYHTSQRLCSCHHLRRLRSRRRALWFWNCWFWDCWFWNCWHSFWGQFARVDVLSVLFHVPGNMPAAGCCVVAALNRTMVWLFTSVSALVCREVRRLRRGIITARPVTLKRFLAGVHTHVTEEMACARRSVVAAREVAFVWLQAGMRLHVLTHITAPPRRIRAAWDRALVGAIIGHMIVCRTAALLLLLLLLLLRRWLTPGGSPPLAFAAGQADSTAENFLRGKSSLDRSRLLLRWCCLLGCEIARRLRHRLDPAWLLLLCHLLRMLRLDLASTLSR